jgi:TRAP-type C4-dicarboxylate transport system substrate-binding protein
MIAAAAASMMLEGAPAASAQQTLVWSSMGSSKNPILKCNAMKFANEFAKKSGGRYRLETHIGAAAFANPRKQYQQVAKNITNFSSGVLFYAPGRFPLTELVSLPFLANDNIALARALHGLVPKYLKKEFSDVHLMALPIPSLYQIHMRKPISKISDLKGKRVRAAGRGLIDALKLLGANPVLMPVTKQYENLQKGVIAGTIGTNATLVAFKVFEVTKFHMMANIAATSVFNAMSHKFYDGLPNDLRRFVDEQASGPAYSAKLSQCWDKPGKIGLQLAKKKGNKIVNADPADRAATAKKVAPVTEKILASLEARGLPARAFHKDLLAAIAREEAK